jgi:multiple sugar transport system permease protein
MRRKRIKMISIYALIAAVCFLAIFPVYWLFNTSLQSPENLYQWPPTLFPTVNPIISYFNYLRESEVIKWIGNSLFIATAGTFIGIFIGTFGGYSASRFKFKGKISYLVLMLASQMIPTAFIVIPIYWLFAKVALTDTHIGLILLYSAMNVPITVWFFKGFFDSIPRELEEASKIDGCNSIGTLFKIMIPLIVPGIIATGTWGFIMIINEYILASTLIRSPKLYTIPVGLASQAGQHVVSWDTLMSGAIISSIPTVILFIFAQKYMAGGLLAGSVKQ